MFKKIFCNFQTGNILLFAVVFGFISFSLIVVGVSGYAISEHKASVYKHNSEMAFHIAEAGINYYKWHLAHDGDDFQDGTGLPGPYEHEYRDKDNNLIGYFSLEITPPPTTSTIVTIASTGWIVNQPESRRTIRAKFGYESLTDYALASNTAVWIGDGQIVNGRLHSNSGIRFDGTANSIISSAVATYTCKEHIGCGFDQEKDGIWGDGEPKDYWKFPVPAEDFEIVTAELAVIRDSAQTNGIYLSPSGEQGWRLEFLANGSINIYKVTATNCYKGQDIGESKFEWFCVDVKTLGTPVNYSAPANGFIFVDDDVWVDGVVNGYVTVGTGEGKSVIINNDITYTAKDGNHLLGLIGKEDVLLPHDSPEDLEINAVLLAQNGAAKRYFYSGDTKDSLTLYGSVVSHDAWTFNWSSGGGSIVSGYEVVTINYDPSLLYNPPAGFPTGSEYHLVKWEEI